MPDAELRSEDNEQVLTNLLESPERQVYVITELLPVSPHSSVTTKYLLQRSNMEHLTRLIIIPCQLEREECDVTAPHPLLASDTTRGVSHITPTRWRHQRRDISLWSGPLSSARDSNICVQQLKFKFWTIQFMFVIIILTKIFLRLNRPLSQNQLYFHES